MRLSAIATFALVSMALVTAHAQVTVETVVEGLNNPCGVTIQPGTGHLFVADRNNNRIQVFDQQMRFLDDWRHFGRPSGLAITSDDTLYVSDSESSKKIAGAVRNPGWKNGVRIGSARDGSLSAFIAGTDPEGLGADDMGNVFAGLTRAPRLKPPLIQKWVKK